MMGHRLRDTNKTIKKFLVLVHGKERGKAEEGR
jgi:hypothetical protein